MALQTFIQKSVSKYRGGKFLIYGEAGLGKTTLALKFPYPVLIDAEEGSELVVGNEDIPRLKVDDYASFIALYKELRAMKHPYKTLIIDTIDWFESVLYNHAKSTLAKEKQNDSKEIWTKTKELTDEFWIMLNVLAQKGMNIVLVAHQGNYKIEDTTVEGAYQRACLKLSRWTSGRYKEGADHMLYMHLDIQNVVKNRAVMGTSDNNSIVALECGTNPAYDAKTRLTGIKTTLNPRVDNIVEIFKAVTTHMTDERIAILEKHYGDKLNATLVKWTESGLILNNDLATMSDTVYCSIIDKINEASKT